MNEKQETIKALKECPECGTYYVTECGYCKFADLKEILDDANIKQLETKQTFLRSLGWSYSCRMAGLWLWYKEIEGVMHAMDENSAILVEGYRANQGCYDEGTPEERHNLVMSQATAHKKRADD